MNRRTFISSMIAALASVLIPWKKKANADVVVPAPMGGSPGDSSAQCRCLPTCEPGCPCCAYFDMEGNPVVGELGTVRPGVGGVLISEEFYPDLIAIAEYQRKIIEADGYSHDFIS